MCQICDETYFLSSRQRIQLSKDLNIDGLVGKAINQLYDDRKIDKKTKAELLKSHYEPLKQAVNEGYTAKVEFGTPNYEFLKQLQTNTAVFAAFKNHSSIKEMSALLKDKEGNLRSKEDFKKEALKVDADYRITKLDVEYDTAVRTARMAANWQDLQAQKDVFPNLEYKLTRAAKPDENHRKYVGIIRPIDDPFWDAHYPPNRWRCQCSVAASRKDATDIPNNLPPVPKEFTFNAGKQGQIFNVDESSYAKGTTKAEKAKLLKEAKSVVDVEAAKNAPYQTLYTSKNGGSVEAHPLSFDDKEFEHLRKIATSLANNGKKMQLLPVVEDTLVREALLPKEIVQQTRTPDYFIDKSFTADLKKVEGLTKNSIKRPFSEIKGQSENVIIEIPDEYPFEKEVVIKMIKNKMAMPESKDIKEVWVDYKGEWLFNPHKK